MLNIARTDSLCDFLKIEPLDLDLICQNLIHQPHLLYRKMDLLIKGKLRPIVKPLGTLSGIQKRINHRLQQLPLHGSIYGGRKGRSAIDNALLHCRKPYIIKMDIKDFFPSITNKRVYELFWKKYNCSPDIARILTRLTTYEGCLPQGAHTSPIIASAISEPLAHRISVLSKQRNATFSIYIDDITVSGGLHIEKMIPVIESIIEDLKFRVHPGKTEFISNDDVQIVTGVRVNYGRDIPPQKIKELRARLRKFDKGLEFLSEKEFNSIRGLITYFANLNPGTAKHYKKELRRIVDKQRSLRKAS